MANLPIRTTADVAADHVTDHNTLHSFHNLIDAAGDLIVGTGVDTAGRLAKGAALTALRVNAAATALEWADLAALFLGKADVAVAKVAADQATTSTAYTDLATGGPAVTVTTGTRALLVLTGSLRNSTVGGYALMGFTVSGATTVAAADVAAMAHVSSTGNAEHAGSWIDVVTGLTPGSNTFTTKYRATTGTATFNARKLVVIPLD